MEESFMLRAATLSLAFVAAPTFAQSYYHAEPEVQPAQARFLVRENIWRCDSRACQSARTAARPAIVCQTLVREVGRLRSFSVEGRAFAAEELESCNMRARQN
ncbi:hypothetical protein RCO27_17430 [Sphingosinicella sp. LHD-64]|uniref:CC_3452 family protein n=1 Tax=Sphingosinicella sp. LHD-64 TaxID=3072139 RepID=UPI00280CC994|nr:hypothetical protein [Sphingosinicella sp. LHD-64]MDQ8758011.1 hypothetical protein [Sphingosinicella sp. LHD-64]